MKVISCEVENFGSYEHLEFNFDRQGLTLIQGPTGSGKSTLCDIIPWIVFGRTSKDGAVDEVLSWPGDKVTKGHIICENISIYRIRGKGKNDLYFSTYEGEITRGKDLQDTQKLINNHIGMNINLYLSGAYFHEFSQTAQFFTTTPKNRRMICEQLTDLSLAKTLQEKSTLSLKESHAALNILRQAVDKLNTNIETITRIQKQELTRKDRWEIEHLKALDFLKIKAMKYEDDKEAKLNKFMELMKEDRKKLRESSVCGECGADKKPNPNAESHFKTHIDELMAQENPYVQPLAEKQLELNPYTDGVKDYTFEINDKTKLLEYHIRKEAELASSINDLDMLSSIIAEFRSILVRNSILSLEQQTNHVLSEYFDAELRITMESQESDKLDVSIYKDGNQCVYTQLSKGQRQLLKLAFGISVMKQASNHNGIQFSSVFFDEALDGLDETFKIKAFRLLKSLESSYDIIFVVEHSNELKTMFDNSVSVRLVNGKSKINAIIE